MRINNRWEEREREEREKRKRERVNQADSGSKCLGDVMML